MRFRAFTFLFALLTFGGCAPAPADTAGGGFGAFGKADGDSTEVDLPAATDEGPGEVALPAHALEAQTRLRLEPLSAGGEPNLPEDLDLRLQIAARSDIYSRTSFAAERPTLVLPTDRGHPTYEVVLRNWSPTPVRVALMSTEEPAPEAGIQTYFNQPDCDSGCADDRPIGDPRDPSNGMRGAITDAIQGARQSIDFSIFGIEDAAIQQALCNAATAGVTVRVVTDWRSRDPENSRGYYAALAELAACISPFEGAGDEGRTLGEADFSDRGIQFVMNNAIMHHKFYIIDRGTEHELLVNGSANQTTAGLEKNHNHMLFIRGVPGLTEAYAAEFEQLFTHCRANTDSRGRACSECTPACSLDLNDEGTWSTEDPELGLVEMWAYFSPTLANRETPDDALRILRGPIASRDWKIGKRGSTYCVSEERGPWGRRETVAHDCVTADSSSSADLATARARATEIRDGLRAGPDPSCNGPGSTCACHRASSGLWACDYCGGADGTDWGLLGEAERRVAISIFAGTDLCFGLAVGRAAQRPGVEALAIFDRVNSFGEYARDDYVCSMGAETYVDDWAGQSAIIFNHNKIVVVDDIVFDGSMNLSASGSDKNNENTVVYRGAGIARVFGEYIGAEAALLRRRAIRRRMEDVCHEEPMAARCDAIQAQINRGEGDALRRTELTAGLERCQTLATAWGERCATWEADPEGWVAAEVGSMRDSGLYDNPKSLRDCACNDHIDNDRDGLVDQQHPACGEDICFDGVDGDGDGLIDAIDPDCSIMPESAPETSTP